MRVELPRFIAHRCGGTLAPENTLAGLHAAAAKGFRAVEFDVMLSADGTPVLIHDETLERTTNGIGRVCETPDAVLFSLDAGQGERIPTLAEAATLCRRYGLIANVEIKPAAGFEAKTGEVVAAAVQALWANAPAPLLSSFSFDALDSAATAARALSRGLLYETVPEHWQDDAARHDAASVHCAARKLSDSTIASVREAGLPLLCYTVNDPAEAEALFRRGVSAVFTDRLDRFG